LRNVY